MERELEETMSVPSKKKKGITNPSCYKRNIIKLARVKGTHYTDWKGNRKPEIKQGEDCKCKKKCYHIVNEHERSVLWSKFRSFETKNEQDSYLQSLMTSTSIQRRRRRINEEVSKVPDRSATYKYEVSTTNGKFQVCKKAFCSIHGITPARVRRLTNLLSMGKSPLDKRGKNISGNTKPGWLLETIREHISSFPVKTAHYSNKEYNFLSAKLNVLIMYNMFIEKYPNLKGTVKSQYYRKVFLQSFTLQFGHPQVDTCCTCEQLEVKINSKFLNDVAKRVHVAEKIAHIRRSKKFFLMLKTVSVWANNDNSVGAVAIDYMQNLMLPQIPVQETFYLRQLTVNVFGVHNLKDDTAVFFVYHEGMGLKSPNEVCSFLMQYISMSLNNVNKLHIFCDGCGGQNKNHTLLRLMSALVSQGKFESIVQYFPIRGHSFMPCDRDFAVFKRKIKRCGRVYTIKEYVELILSSSNKQKFLVVVPDSEDIIDYKSWWPQFYKRSMLSVETSGKRVPKDSKVTFKISKFNQFIHSSAQKGIVVAKTYIDGAESHTFSLRNSNPDPLSLPSQLAYPTGRVPINKKKIDDIKKLQSYLPEDEEVKTFYSEILAWPTVDGDIIEGEKED